jgi:putative membrane protein
VLRDESGRRPRAPPDHGLDMPRPRHRNELMMTNNTTSTDLRWLATGALALLAALLVSGWQPYDRVTWLMEVAPVLIVLPLLAVTRRSHPLTPLLYALIFAHSLILMLGGAYTYARVPLGFWIQDAFELTRNPYDKIGHFMQGFVPAIAAREIMLRSDHVAGRKMLAFLVICVVLAISASYELIEWAAALALGQGADEFLGTQGDPWDTQSDMFMALIGAVCALLLLSRLHDAQLARKSRP